ncbi:MAG: DnaJ domain-containing protein [Acidobacteria bacterium]|nr:DnaJ domain-containing protein [Acidobacteriota bacterium]
MDDIYKMLNIPRQAGEAEVRECLRRELRTWTQRESNAATLEKRQEAERMIKLIDEAETTLSDPRRRAEYDQRLDAFLEGGGDGAARQADETVGGLIEKAALLLRMGNYPPAISLLKRAVNYDPANAMAERMLKNAKREWGQYLLKNH